jgi:hypothetical protein
VRMFRVRLQTIKVNYIDEADLQILEALPEDGNGSKSLLCQDVSCACDYNVRFDAGVVTGPLPDADALCAMDDRSVHVEIDKVRLLIRNNHVDIVFTPQAVIRLAEEAVGVGRKIDARDIGALIADEIESQDPRE